MRRLSTFIFGMAVGGLLVYVALNYHLIHANDGVHMIPKVNATLAGAYVDIRQFGPGDWTERPEIAMAIFRAERGDLMGAAATDSLQTGIDRLLAPAEQ
jgi:hypothetical protein